MTHSAATYSALVDPFWEHEILPALCDYIKIPCLSLDFDPHWQQNGHLEAARRLAIAWLEHHREPSWQLHDLQLPGRTPLIIVEIPGDDKRTVLLYGHLDKQPEMEGWDSDLGPWQPVIKNGRLYGRGGGDDGYALFAAIAAIKALRQQQRPHGRLLILIEFSEESGSPDLPAYLTQHSDLIGTPDLVIALDSGAGDYERLWSTTSLRGMQGCTVTVKILTTATHSGIASGIVADSMRILRLLLDRIEDPLSGQILLPELTAEIPEIRLIQTRETANILGTALLQAVNALPGLQAVSDDPFELLLNNAWRPTLCITGQDGLPPTAKAGNVMRAETSLKLSFRLPPTVDYRIAQDAIRQALLRDPPYQAQVSVKFDQGGNGWEAPHPAPWLLRSSDQASQDLFGNPAAYLGLGASIPFMHMLGQQYPEAQFLITGVLGPGSNAHGPNEFLDIEYAKKLTACIAHVIACHFQG